MIPAFTASGVLPPFTGPDPTYKAFVSPYMVTMGQIVQRFGTSHPRKEILIGLLRYRQDLAKISIVDGFQWIDGSFCEDVEINRARPPGDVDVVTVARRPNAAKSMPDWLALINGNLEIFHPAKAKLIYKVEGFVIDLDKDPDLIVEDTAYWYGLFSHQREMALWKGMLKVPLISDDVAAWKLLEASDVEAP
jgi:hypothetical protein